MIILKKNTCDMRDNTDTAETPEERDEEVEDLFFF